MICADLMLHGICYWSKNSWSLSNEAFCKPDVTGKKNQNMSTCTPLAVAGKFHDHKGLQESSGFQNVLTNTSLDHSNYETQKEPRCINPHRQIP